MKAGWSDAPLTFQVLDEAIDKICFLGEGSLEKTNIDGTKNLILKFWTVCRFRRG